MRGYFMGGAARGANGWAGNCYQFFYSDLESREHTVIRPTAAPKTFTNHQLVILVKASTHTSTPIRISQ
jgi:hypothetical protein